MVDISWPPLLNIALLIYRCEVPLNSANSNKIRFSPNSLLARTNSTLPLAQINPKYLAFDDFHKCLSVTS